MVGFWLVLQQTPRNVTAAPPVLVTFPPEMAVVEVMFVTLAVVTDGTVAEGEVVKDF